MVCFFKDFFFFNNFRFRRICKNSTESSCAPFTQLSPMITSDATRAHYQHQEADNGVQHQQLSSGLDVDPTGDGGVFGQGGRVRGCRSREVEVGSPSLGSSSVCAVVGRVASRAPWPCDLCCTANRPTCLLSPEPGDCDMWSPVPPAVSSGQRLLHQGGRKGSSLSRASWAPTPCEE